MLYVKRGAFQTIIHWIIRSETGVTHLAWWLLKFAETEDQKILRLVHHVLHRINTSWMQSPGARITLKVSSTLVYLKLRCDQIGIEVGLHQILLDK